MSKKGLRTMTNNLKSALLAYAGQAPLDRLSPREIQRDLRAIAGQPHIHRASISSDQCWVCKRDLRDPIHLRKESDSGATP